MRLFPFVLLVAYGHSALSQELEQAQNLSACDLASLEVNLTITNSSLEEDIDVAKQQEEITKMEEKCEEIYFKYQTRLDKIETKEKEEEIDYDALKADMTIEFQKDFDELVRKRDIDLEDIVINAEEHDWSDTKKKAETAEIQYEWDRKFDDFYEDQERKIAKEQTDYLNKLEGCREDMLDLENDFEDDVGHLVEKTLKKVAPTAYKMRKKQKEVLIDIEKKMKKVKAKFSGGICCNFDETNTMMDEVEAGEYVRGLEKCFVFAMRKNGLTCNIREMTLECQEPMHMNTCFNTTTAEADGRRLWGSSCGACYSSSCGFSCPSNSYRSSGWRRELEESNLRGSQGISQLVDDSLPQSGRELDAGKDVQEILEDCILEFVKRRIPRVFCDTEEAKCESCDLGACESSSVSAERFDW